MIAPVERRRTFARFRRDGIRVGSGAVRVSYLGLDRLGPRARSPQVAFAFGRRFGSAVERNRARRRLRAAFVDGWRTMGAGRRQRLAGAYLLSGSRGLLTAPFPQLVADVDRCLDALERRATERDEPTIDRRRRSGRTGQAEWSKPSDQGEEHRCDRQEVGP